MDRLYEGLWAGSGIIPMGTVENGHIRLQSGQIASIENENAKTE
jgi:hypothetical protein